MKKRHGRPQGPLVERGELGAQLFTGLPYDRILAIILALEPTGGLEQDPVRVAALAALGGEGHPHKQPVAL
jgi:hypothetical protein